jgi:hypothetical protein
MINSGGFQYNKKTKLVRKVYTDNINTYPSHKILYTLTKSHSPSTIVFLEDREDPWLILVKTYRTKTGVITNSSIIIKPDIETHLSYAQSNGFQLKK